MPNKRHKECLLMSGIKLQVNSLTVKMNAVIYFTRAAELVICLLNSYRAYCVRTRLCHLRSTSSQIFINISLLLYLPTLF